MHHKDRENRRSTQRRKMNESIQYSNSGGAIKEGRLINLGGGGARLITDLDLAPGENILIHHKASIDVTLRCEVEVRWIKPLSGAGCQVVGVKELRTVAHQAV